MNFLRQGFRKLSSDRHTDRHTETTKIIYDAASRVVNLQTSEGFSSAVSGDDDATVDVLSLAKCLVERDGVQDDSIVKKRSVFITLLYSNVRYGEIFCSTTHIWSLSAQCISSIGQIIKSVCVSASE